MIALNYTDHKFTFIRNILDDVADRMKDLSTCTNNGGGEKKFLQTGLGFRIPDLEFRGWILCLNSKVTGFLEVWVKRLKSREK